MSSFFSAGGEIVAGQRRDPAPEICPASVGPGLVALVGDKRVAGDAGAEDLGAWIAGIGRKRIVRRADRPPLRSARRSTASQRRIMRSAPPVSNVRLSGKERDRPDRQAGADQRARELARLAIDDRDRAANAGGRDKRAIGRNGKRDDRRWARLRPRRVSRQPVTGNRPCRRRPPATISPSAPTATALSGAGRV